LADSLEICNVDKCATAGVGTGPNEDPPDATPFKLLVAITNLKSYFSTPHFGCLAENFTKNSKLAKKGKKIMFTDNF